MISIERQAHRRRDLNGHFSRSEATLLFLTAAIFSAGCASRDFAEARVASATGTLSYTPMNDSPGWMSVVTSDTDLQNAVATRPCDKTTSIRFLPVLDGVDLKAYTAANAGHGTSYVLVVDALMTVKNSAAVTVGSERETFHIDPEDLDGATAGMKLRAISLGWNGTYWADDTLVAVPSGTYAVAVNVRLIRINTATRNQIQLDAGTLAVDLTKTAPTSACNDWRTTAGRLGEASDKTVVVEEKTTGARPFISWRDEKPQMVFGNFGKRTTGTRLQFVKTALWNERLLYGVTTATQLDTLTQRREIAQDGGGYIIEIEQTNIQWGARPLFRSRMTAYFDSTDRLLFISGTLRPDLGAFVPDDRFDASEAEATVSSYLVSRGLSTSRNMSLARNVIYDNAGVYEAAYEFEVSPVSHSDGSYRCLVSAYSNEVLLFEQTSSPSQTPTVSVLDFDPDLIADPDRTIRQGSANLIAQSRQIKIDDFTTANQLKDTQGSNPLVDFLLFLQPAACSSGGLVGCTALWTNPPTFNRSPEATIPPGVTIPVASVNRALLAFAQVQRFQSIYGLYVVPSPAPIHIEAEAQNGGNSFYYASDNELEIDAGFNATTYPNVNHYTPTHEFFHHLDAESVCLPVGCRTVDLPCNAGDPSDCSCRVGPNPMATTIVDRSDDPRMPYAIKEGIADFAMLAAEPWSAQNVIPGIGYIFECLEDILDGGGYSSCYDRSVYTYRRTTNFIHPGSMDSPISLWPDCRGWRPQPSDCILAVRPAFTNRFSADFVWQGSPVTENSAHGFWQQTLLHIWEEATSGLAGTGASDAANYVATQWPKMVFMAFTTIPDDSSFSEFAAAIQFASIIHISRIDVSHVSGFLNLVGDALAKHGVDEDLQAFCEDNDQCH